MVWVLVCGKCVGHVQGHVWGHAWGLAWWRGCFTLLCMCVTACVHQRQLFTYPYVSHAHATVCTFRTDISCLITRTPLSYPSQTGQEGEGVVLPGFALGSIAYHSDGTILTYLDASEPPTSNSAPRFGPGDVVGCGWEPASGTFVFTLNGDVVLVTSGPVPSPEGGPAALFPVCTRVSTCGCVCARLCEHVWMCLCAFV